MGKSPLGNSSIRSNSNTSRYICIIWAYHVPWIFVDVAFFGYRTIFFLLLQAIKSDCTNFDSGILPFCQVGEMFLELCGIFTIKIRIIMKRLDICLVFENGVMLMYSLEGVSSAANFIVHTRVLQKVLSLGSDYFSATFHQTYFYYKPSKYSPFTETHFCNFFTQSLKADE